MIYSLNGILQHVFGDFFVLECGGVGIKCKSDSKTIGNLSSSLGSRVKILTRMVVRENSWDLFGFKEPQSVELFDLLTSVTGVGPKASLSILSTFSPGELIHIISQNNAEILTNASGVGEKMAKRILLELKGKIKKISKSDEIVVLNNNKKEALSALEVLGYSKRDVSKILEKLDSSMSVESIIRNVLKEIGK